MNTNDIDSIKILLEKWKSSRKWAEKLLVDSFNLNEVSEILLPQHRGNKQIPGTKWFYRTHGVGIDVYQPGNKGGIDFDFNQTNPCQFKLREFLVKQINAGLLPKGKYRPLLQDESKWNNAIGKVLPTIDR